MSADEIPAQPWYRERWPWILMAGPATVVVAGLFTAWLAVRSDDGLFSLQVDEPHHTIPALLSAVQQQGAQLAHLTTRQASLEDVFVKLTGRHLRED